MSCIRDESGGILKDGILGSLVPNQLSYQAYEVISIPEIAFTFLSLDTSQKPQSTSSRDNSKVKAMAVLVCRNTTEFSIGFPNRHFPSLKSPCQNLGVSF